MGIIVDMCYMDIMIKFFWISGYIGKTMNKPSIIFETDQFLPLLDNYPSDQWKNIKLLGLNTQYFYEVSHCDLKSGEHAHLEKGSVNLLADFKSIVFKELRTDQHLTPLEQDSISDFISASLSSDLH